ncbi:short-chain dehydrogenase [Corynespora cassiicola Philippines]|uniref:Short-chain dehydrogenase n=1 Tax=Corynespora cassiicola Philippines TaxID=1448308 RepID=A0A2T2N7B4_CORCC|nr:short-chain dehydrogenase [Corynespora cassiicola Philippines]
MADDHTRYAPLHAHPKGPGDSRPTALQIIQDTAPLSLLPGKTAIVTGVSSGLGPETAKALKASGMRVFGLARDLSKARHALGDALEDGKLELLQCDLESLESVRRCVDEFKAKQSGGLHVLVNNAGVMQTPEGRTREGFETQFGVNHLAHFLLFTLLKDTMLASATPEFGARVVNVSSTGHRYGSVHFENLNLEGIYTPGLGYGQAKTANIWMANEIERRYGSQNLHGFSLHPGGIWTGLQVHVPKEQMEMWSKMDKVREMMKSPEQGAATQVWAAVAKEWEGKGGVYLEDCQVSKPVKEGYTPLDPGYEKHVYDEEGAKKLWKVSLKLVGLEGDE